MLILIFLFIFNLSLAQSLVSSPPIDFHKESVYKLAGNHSTHFLLKEKFNAFALIKFNDSLQIIQKREFKTNFQLTETLYFFYKGDELHLICTGNKWNQGQLRYIQFSSTLQVKKDTLLYQCPKGILSDQIYSSISDNKERLLIYLKKNSKIQEYSSFHFSANELLTQKINLDIQSELISGLISNSGIIYFVSELNYQFRKKEDHKIEIYKIQEKETQKLIIPAYHLSFIDSKYIYDEINNQLIGLNLYSKNSSETQGILYFRTQFNDSTINSSIDFDDTYIRNLTGDKKKKVYGIPNLEIKDLILRKDGGVLLVTEQNLKYETNDLSSTFGFNSTLKQTDFLFENLAIVNIHPSGQVHWKQVIYKNQLSENDQGRYSSFTMMKSNANIYVLFNEEIKWGSPMVSYELNTLGELKKNKLFERSVLDLMPEFTNAIQISLNSVLTCQYKHHKLKLIKLNLQ